MVHYWSWRAIHYVFAIFAFGAFFCILSLFLETSHPGTKGVGQYQESGGVLLKWRPVILNPFPQLLDLRSPTVLVAVRNFCLNSLERTDL